MHYAVLINRAAQFESVAFEFLILQPSHGQSKLFGTQAASRKPAGHILQLAGYFLTDLVRGSVWRLGVDVYKNRSKSENCGY